jgi:hypothetical protein
MITFYQCIPMQRTGNFPSLYLIIKAKGFLVRPSEFAPVFRLNYSTCHRQVIKTLRSILFPSSRAGPGLGPIRFLTRWLPYFSQRTGWVGFLRIRPPSPRILDPPPPRSNQDEFVPNSTAESKSKFPRFPLILPLSTKNDRI